MMTQSQQKRKLKWTASEKQHQALVYLTDDETTEVVYGGAASGGKSFLGCAWLITKCYEYPGIRCLLGRSVLKQLKQSTLLTFFDVCKEMGLTKDEDYTYNMNDGIIHFKQTGSDIYIKDLAYYPSDPEYDSLGSTEFTYAFVDEASQITNKCRNVLKSRLRYKVNQYKIRPKLLMTCNPSKNFLYMEFYKPWKQGELSDDKKFIPATVRDNPYASRVYIENLKSLDKASQERLLFGNWEYDEDPAALIEFDALTDIFSNKADTPDPKDEEGNEIEDTRLRYITCDVARFGGDRTVICVWKGMECIKILVYKKTSMHTVAKLIREQATIYNVPASRIIVDEDGVGGGVKDILPGIKGFVANSRPRKNQNYNNFKSQCHFVFAKAVNDRKIAIRTENVKLRESIIEEMEQIKARDIDKDGKMSIVRKEEVKQKLGRSPDISDAIVMRMAFEFTSQPNFSWIRV